MSFQVHYEACDYLSKQVEIGHQTLLLSDMKLARQLANIQDNYQHKLDVINQLPSKKRRKLEEKELYKYHTECFIAKRNSKKTKIHTINDVNDLNQTLTNMIHLKNCSEKYQNLLSKTLNKKYYF
jgi:hypothetical protein